MIENEKEKWRLAKYYRSRTGIIENIPEIEISNLGNFRYTKTKKKIYITKDKSNYPVLRYYSNKTQYTVLVHILMASTFLKIPKESGYVVDHINHDKSCFNLTNLRFITSSENAKNSLSKEQKIVFINKKIFSCIKSTEITSKDRKLLNRKICNKKEQQDWITMSLDMYNSLLNDNINLKDFIQNLDNLIWKKIADNKFICSLGIIKNSKNNTKIFNYSYGNLNNSGYYVTSKVYKKYSNLVHRIVAQVFLNKDEPLKDKEVDHIDTNPKNNALINLRIANSHRENISNPNTIINMSKQILCILHNGDKIYFTSRQICAKLLKVGKGTVLNWIKDNSKIEKYYPDVKSLSYIDYPIPENSKVDDFNIIKQASYNINIKEFNTIEDINKFLLNNKIKNRKDLIELGYSNLYWKIKYKKWTNKLIYYKEDENS